MGYYNDDRGYGRGGYGGRDNYRGGGYDRRGGGYDRRDRAPFDRFSNPNSRFDIGQKVIHKATGMELSVISFGREQIECRKPDLDTVWVYEYEIEPMNQMGDNNVTPR